MKTLLRILKNEIQKYMFGEELGNEMLDVISKHANVRVPRGPSPKLQITHPRPSAPKIK